MKKIAFLFVAILAFGCSEEKEENAWVEIELPNPGINRILLTEVCESVEIGIPDITRTNEYLFTDGWMKSHAATQQYTVQSEKYTNTIKKTFTYNADHTLATLKDESDNTFVYTLDEQGYATQCTYTSSYQKRVYAFFYTDGYLTKLTEEILPIDNIGEGTISQQLILNYKNGDLISVMSPSLTNESFTKYEESQINYEAGEDVNYYRLPCLLLLDTYPLSYHQEALFAGMLGKPTQHLTVYTSPDHTIEGNTEYTTYAYKFDSNGKPTFIQSLTHYTGGSYQEGFPNKRNISIAID